MEGDKAVPLRVDAETAIILREAYHKIEALFRADHYGLYDYVRVVAGKIARVDAFFVGFLQGSSRVRYPYAYDEGRYVDPDTHIFGPNGQTCSARAQIRNAAAPTITQATDRIWDRVSTE